MALERRLLLHLQLSELQLQNRFSVLVADGLGAPLCLVKHSSNLSVDPGVDNRDLDFKTSGTLFEDQLLGRERIPRTIGTKDLCRQAD